MEWKKYKCGNVSTRSNWVNPDCQPVASVLHTAHITDALRIIEDGHIRSSLVWDESKLRNTRTCVSWVSPNYWQYSLYGNIRFTFDWPQLAKGKLFYWVEVIKHYQPPAYRILVTNTRHNSDGLQEYDFTINDGPLYYDQVDGTWYCNGEYNGELMIESDLSLNMCREIDFVAHHQNICNKYLPTKKRGTCPDLDLSRNNASRRFLSTLLGRGMTQVNRMFLDQSKRETLGSDTLHRLIDLFASLIRGITSKEPVISKSEYQPLLKAALQAYSNGNPEESRKILDLFGSRERVLKAAETLIDSHFGVQIKADADWRDLY